VQDTPGNYNDPNLVHDDAFRRVRSECVHDVAIYQILGVL